MFFSKNRNTSAYVDTIFPVTSACRKDKDASTINGTIGSFYTEEGIIATYRSVFESFRSLNNETMASYAASSFGNADYNEAMSSFVLEGRIKHHRTIPAPGGTGCISTGMGICLERGDTILIPEISWGNYRTIAAEFGLEVITYDPYDLDDMFRAIDRVDRVFLVVNSPCQNPCGLSYTYEQWKKIVDKLNCCGREAILLNDVAYIDYAFNKNCKDYFGLFNELSDNVLVLIAYSCSKAFSYYGMRLGSLFIIHNDEELLDTLLNQCARRARTTFSSVSNSAMHNIRDIVSEHLDDYLKEKETFIGLLKKRTDIFLEECAACGLEHYPYNEGFFVTLSFEDNGKRDEVFGRFLKDHIYCIKVNKGIRVGLCAIPLDKVHGLAERMKGLV
ncbi:MAG: aminotransferase class I/II-fold pyridoxal phosphate-dependent enzyme [Erysipelotrichaceae bacterium]|nr:aminotransferase class I/II-fold pyridoxal phosphate-dependent enzyme [Erysipelotrichaceae bacterium]